MKLYILISLLVGVAIGLPVEDGGIHEEKQNLVIEELQQNLSSIWVEINELKVNLEAHIKETDPQNYYDPTDHGHDHGADHQHGHQEGEYHGDHHHDYHEHGHHQEGENYTADATEGGGYESGGYDHAYDPHHEYDHHHHHHADYDHHLQHEGTGNTQDQHPDDHHHQDQHHGDHHHQDQHHDDHYSQDQYHGYHRRQDQHQQEGEHSQDQYHGYHRRQDQHQQEGENDDDNDHDQNEKDNGSQEDNSEENVDGGASGVKSSYRNDSPQSGGEDHPHHHDHGHHHYHQRRRHQKDFLKAKCHILPNSEVPESNVSGHITISQKKDASGPLYFKIDMKGFTVSKEEGTGYVHGFHIHENPIQEQKCSSAGPHFNPHGNTHGAPYAVTRHVGDLGNIRVDDKGRFENQVISDDQVAFFGKNSIIGRSIVVHLKADDLGLGGDEESLKTGNAGARLACCTIESINVPKPVKPVIRFNG